MDRPWNIQIDGKIFWVEEEILINTSRASPVLHHVLYLTTKVLHTMQHQILHSP
jgi:hypothetical protein